MTNTINDHVFQLQWDGSKVTRGIDAVEARLYKLQKGVGSKLSSAQERATSGRITKSRYNAEKVLRDKQRSLAALAKQEADSEWQQLKAQADQADHYQKRQAANAKAQIKSEREKNAQLRSLARQRIQEASFETARLRAISSVSDKQGMFNRIGASAHNARGAGRDAILSNVSTATSHLSGFQGKYGAAGSIKSRGDLARMQQDLIKVNSLTKQLGGHAKVVSKQFSVVQNVTKRVGATFLAMGASTFGAYAVAGGAQASFSAAKEYEQLDIAMTAAFGSQQAANREMEYAENVAKKYALDIMSVGEGWSKISYAAKMSNMPIEKARQMFEDLAVSSRAFGLSADDTKGAMRAVIQMMGKGKVNAEDLRQQLAERIPAAIPMLAKSMGITIAELEKQMKKGLVPAEKLVGMFSLMASDVKGSGALNKSLKSMGAAQTSLSNALKKSSKLFWGDGMKGGFKDFIFMITTFLEKNEGSIQQWGNTFSIAGKIVLDTLGAISPILSTVNTGLNELSQLTMTGSVSKTQFGQLNTLGKTLAVISWLIHDVKLAYEGLQVLISGGEVSGGQHKTEPFIARSKSSRRSFEDQQKWETKYGGDLKVIEDRLLSKQLKAPASALFGHKKQRWLMEQAEQLNTMRSSLGGKDAYSFGMQSGSFSNMYRIGEKLATNLTQGKLEFKLDASDVIKLSRDGTADVSIPYGFQLGFSDSGGKNRGI